MASVSPISPRLVKRGIATVHPDTTALQSFAALQYDADSFLKLGLTFRPRRFGDPVKKDVLKKLGCRYFFTIDETSFTEAWEHGSAEVLGMPHPAKRIEPTGY